MIKLQFESKLTLEEIGQNFGEVDVYSGIMDGLAEALAYEKAKSAKIPPVCTPAELTVP